MLLSTGMSRTDKETNGKKWIELIRVRSSVKAIEQAMPGLTAQIHDIESSSRQVETFIMRHAIYDGDLAVGIVWRDNSKAKKSREGLLVASKLEQLGSVDHAVWVPAG
jgi:hypothetical protein